jgi:hypothetical protein
MKTYRDSALETDFLDDLHRLEQAISSSTDAADMRQPITLKKLRDALTQLEMKTLDHGRFFNYNAEHGRHERMLEARTVQHQIDQLFAHLDKLESTANSPQP